MSGKDTKSLITGKAVKQVLAAYWREYKKRPWRTFIGFFLPAVGTVCVFYIPPLIVARVVNIYAANSSIELSSLAPYIVLFGGSWLLGEVLWRIGMHFIARVVSESVRDLSDEAFNRIIQRDYNFYSDNFVGTLTRRAQGFSRGIEPFTDTLVYGVVGNIFPIIFAFVVLSQYSYTIALILVVAVTVVTAVAIPLVRVRAKLVAVRQEAGSKTTGRLSDALTNILAIKSFAKEKSEEKNFAAHVAVFNKAYIKAFDFQNLKIYGSISPIYVLSNVAGLIAVLHFSSQYGFQAGTILLVFAYYSQVTLVFWNIQNTYRQLESAVTESSEFTQLLIDPPMIEDAEDAGQLTITNSGIEFKDLRFTYPGHRDDSQFLQGFNLIIKPHERVGLVGPSGGGKTTITKLILRFIDPQSGEIMIDGQDIKKVTQTSLREMVSYVPQEPLLFHRSLFENIAYANENATEEEVIRAAKLAHAHEFIVGLPDGYKTLVGERGVKLSGGQRQRVAIARAILKDAPILVLDEATSSLDSESEKYIQEGLWELMKGKTALVIAHRLSTIKHLDRIIVLEHGKIVQDGTHDELIKAKGLYARLWSHQSGEFIED